MLWEGVDMLRILQFLELAHFEQALMPQVVEPHPRACEVPAVRTCSTKPFGYCPGCPVPFGGNSPYIGSEPSTTKLV